MFRFCVVTLVLCASSLLALEFFVSLDPTEVYAQAQYGLVPCGLNFDNPETPWNDKDPCGACHFFALVNNIILFLLVPTLTNNGLALVLILGALLLAAGGFMIFIGGLGNLQAISRGRQLLFTTIIGLTIIYGSWAFTGLLLTFFDVTVWTGPSAWWQVQCELEGAPIPPPLPPIAHWDFDDVDQGRTVRDRVATSHGVYDSGAEGWPDGTLTGTSQVAGPPGMGNARSFNGTTDFVQANSLPYAYTPGDNYTYTFHMNMPAVCAPGDRYFLRVGKELEVRRPTCADNIFVNYSMAGTGVTPPGIHWVEILPTPGWHHIAVTVDGTTLTVYVDGVLAGSDSSAFLGSNFAGCIQINPREMNVGRSHSLCPAHLHGDIPMDELRIYDRVLTAGEINNDRTSRYPVERTLLYWSFDSIWGPNTVYDTHHLVKGKYGGAGSFDDLDDLVDVGPELNMGLGDFSMGMWVRELTADYVVGRWIETCTPGYVVYYDNVLGVRALISDGSDCSARGITSSISGGSTAPADPANFHHIVVTVDRNSEMKAFIDGTLDKSDGGNITTEPGNLNCVTCAPLLDFLIGRKNGTPDSSGGLIDDVKIWDRALTDAEVFAEFTSGP